MDAFAALTYVILGAVLGVIGQSLRVIVGLKKQLDKAGKSGKKLKDMFDLELLLTSLIIAVVVGAIAGVLGIMKFMGADITTETLLSLIAIGYSGTDFIEGLAIKRDDEDSIKSSSQAKKKKKIQKEEIIEEGVIRKERK